MVEYTPKINYRHIKIRLFVTFDVLFVDIGYEISTRTYSS